MISHEFTIQEIIAILMDPYEISNELVFWITYKHYPVLSWTRENFCFLNVSQNFNTTSYGKWWIPIKLISKRFSLGSITQMLSSQKSFFIMCHSIEDDWIMIDNQQAGKYVPQNYLYIFYVIIFR